MHEYAARLCQYGCSPFQKTHYQVFQCSKNSQNSMGLFSFNNESPFNLIYLEIFQKEMLL